MTAPHPAGRSARRSRRLRTGPAAALAAPLVVALACQPALGTRDPAAHAVWWVGGALFLILLAILAVEVADWLWATWRRLRGHDPDARR